MHTLLNQTKQSRHDVATNDGGANVSCYDGLICFAYDQIQNEWLDN